MAFHQTSLGRLYVQRFGQGPAITFWHGLLMDGGLWHVQAKELANDHTVLVVDGPSHGRSDSLRRPFTIEQCAGAWIELLQAEQIHQAVFCGLSWGAMTALSAAVREPSRVRGLCLVGVIATASPPSLRARFATFARAVRLVGLPRWLDRAVTYNTLSPEALRDHPELLAPFLDRMRTRERAALHHAIRAVLVERKPVIEELWRIDKPTLVITGAKDRLTPPVCGRAIARAVAGAEHQVIAGAGHVLPLEQPAELTKRMRAWLATL